MIITSRKLIFVSEFLCDTMHIIRTIEEMEANSEIYSRSEILFIFHTFLHIIDILWSFAFLNVQKFAV